MTVDILAGQILPVIVECRLGLYSRNILLTVSTCGQEGGEDV